MKQTVILIHGFATSAKIWNLQIKALAPKFKIYTPELDLSNIKKAAEKLKLFIEEENLKDISLVGWSMGSFVAVKLYLMIPKLINSLILVSTTAKFIKTKDFPFGLPLALLYNLRKKMKADYKQGLKFFHALIFGDELVPHRPPGFITPPPAASFAALDELENLDLRSDLKKIMVSTLLLHGEKDEICLPESAKFMADKIKHARIEIFKGSWHAPFITQADKFNKLIKDFITHAK
jgi:pimeloyl-[acyl-carrier protein] methyl ester esterase